FTIIHTAELEIREAALEDMRFAYNSEEGQWDAATRSDRIKDKRPCLTANKLRKFLSVVASRERENRVAVKVKPVDDQADVTRAAIIEDLVRQIEYQSTADVIYANAGEQAAAGGFAYWRILSEFAEDSFNQDILIREIENPFSVFMDPKGQYCFIRDVLTETEFKLQYPKASPVDFDLSGRGEEWTLWYEPEKVFIAEYFVKEPVTRQLAQVRDQSTREVKTIEMKEGITPEELTKQGFEVIKTRSAKGHKVMWYKMTGHEVLESSEWAGREIPVVEVLGDKVNIAGKVYKRSLIRDGKDPQRMYNYWLTSMTEKVALVPKSPFLATPQQIQGHEAMWDEANQKNFPYLLYNVTAGDKPERQTPAQIDTGSMAMLNIANNDIKDTLGMYESFLGEQSNERSGRAIKMRQQRSDLGTFHFPDNLSRAIIQTGRILIDLIPRIYDTERILRLRNEEDVERFVPINQTVIDEETGREVLINDLSVGKYDVQAGIRPYGTRREETVEMILQAMQYSPQIAPFIVDLLFKYVDSPGAAELKQRIEQFMQSAAPQGGGGGGQVPEIPGL
ncbi:hypothetical protein LCGC14_2261150, partial [marine sediment metagenome]